MTNQEIKLLMIDRLFERGEYCRQVNDTEYRTRCPYCGDSQKNLNTGHLYIRINPSDNFPMVWNCFKCNEHGVVTQSFLSMMDINDMGLKENILSLNKTSDKLKAHKFLNNEKTIFFDYTLPEVIRDKKIAYIEKRLGVRLTDEEIIDMKIITSFREFLIQNNIKTLLMPDNIAHRVEDHFIGFLTYGNSHILFRDITEKDQFRWLKYPITEESKQGRVFYTISGSLDIFTKDNIIINLSEGILDILSAYKNLDYNNPNTMNIAVCGKRYDTVLNYLTSLGLVGDNIIVNIFADNDKVFNEKSKDKKTYYSTTVDYFRKVFKKYKYLYKEVNIYYNVKSKDIGVSKDQIALRKHRL